MLMRWMEFTGSFLFSATEQQPVEGQPGDRAVCSMAIPVSSCCDCCRELLAGTAGNIRVALPPAP